MGLLAVYVATIEAHFYKCFGSRDIYLFGSRVEDNKGVSDIDLYVVVDNHQ